MGRETTAPVTIADAAGRTLESADGVHVLLESAELILRGPFRRRYALADIHDVSATADLLRVHFGDESVEIELPPAVARRWAEKILTPAPTLAEKLGLSARNPPLLLGRLTDPELQEALADVAATPRARADAAAPPDPASSGTRAAAPAAVTSAPDGPITKPKSKPIPIAIAEIDNAGDLDSALEQLRPDTPLWLVHRKGRGTWIGDTAIRETMRARGFVDTKVAAVSPLRTATRYIRRHPQPPRTTG